MAKIVRHLPSVVLGGVAVSSIALTLHLHSLYEKLEQSHEKLNEKYEVVLIENEELRDSLLEQKKNVLLMKEETEKSNRLLEQTQQEIERLTKETEKLQTREIHYKKEIQSLKQEVEKYQAPTVSRGTSTNHKSFYVTATAYTAYCNGCSGTTATGLDLRANPHLKVIAVDPTVIPLGTKVHVEGYGNAVAGDTGGAIKGNKIDLFMPNRSDAFAWGRKKVKITILQ